ncbi:PTS system beta-glucosides-specific transporter subunit IIA [Streptococcus varani]|uniref:PTS system beta-glucosides-specific transporter subunit IIA n=1 Tax=Streptococcus varani TaxID=1608583 RepID=A0A0E4CS30_9STRE|nr:PTS transporter subunit EIIC [Streptococcus varani]CQR24170.1 PTS system beta-glucosides-specific transporter subunit IIA [Streptococcus varani]
MKYQQQIDGILEAVGGKDNVISASHCFTRLRLQFRDYDIVDDAKVRAVKGVVGLNKQGKEYQIIIGTEVGNLYPEFIEAANVRAQEQVQVKEAEAKEKLFDKIIGIVVGTFVPLIGLIAAGGTIKGVLSLLVQLKMMSNESSTYLVLFAAANAIFYFFPVFIGFTAGKKFGATPYLSALIGAILIYPTLIEAATAGNPGHLFAIPLTYLNYSNTVLPAIFAAWLVSILEKFFKKTLPHVLQMVFVPFFVIILAVPIVLLVVGPLVTLLSNVLSAGLEWIFNFSPILTGIIFGGLWSVIILFGLAWVVVPILINYTIQYGYDPIYGMLAPAALGMAGAVLAVALRSKNSELKALGYSTGLTAILGVTEPAMYGIAIPSRKTFVTASIGTAIAGGVVGMMGVKIFAPGLSGIFNVFAYFGGDNLSQNVFWGISTLVIAFVAAFVLTYFFGGWSDEDFESKLAGE